MSASAPERYDLAIIGFGPVGAVAANLAGQAGLRTLVMDKADDIYPMPRALGLDHEVMRILQNLGLADAVAPYVLPYRPSEYRGCEGQLIKRFDVQAEPFPLGYPPSFVFTQPPVDRLIRAAAVARASVEVELSCEVTVIDQDADEVRLRAQRGDGSAVSVNASYVLACDGGSSPTRKRLGIGLTDLGFDEPWLVVDVRVDQDWLYVLPDVNVQYCEPDRPCTFVVGPGNHRRWEFMLRDGETAQQAADPENIRQLIARWIDPAHVEIWRAATYRFHALVTSQWRKGRAFLLGDAAHMTPPFMAQGMCQGIRDAANLVWKLHLVMRGHAEAALLDTYGIERAPHVTTTTALAKTFGEIICERDPDRAAERDRQLLAAVDGVVSTTIRQNLIPALCGGLIDAGSAVAGTLFPQPMLRDGDGSPRLFDAIVGGGFLLVVRATLDLDASADSIARLRHALGTRLVSVDAGTDHVTVDTVDQSLQQWMDRHGCAAVLVRPDHYVYGGASDAAGLHRLTDSLLSAMGIGIPSPQRLSA